ncbi:MAG: AAA family ATPase [Desulfovibrionaceae bacterium]|nr:AAA family ATPase [Desulfovibrionaceae bacterium]
MLFTDPLFSQNPLFENVLSSSLKSLCRAMFTHFEKPVILLLDEYDVPLYSAEQNGYYDEMRDFIRTFLGSVLKDNPNLSFAFLTGCLRVAKESIFTGVNNFVCYSVADVEYSDKFGFTDSEVDELLKKEGMLRKKEEIKQWYDGYCFGKNTSIYCPWDILNYIKTLQADPNALPKAYWMNTSENSIIQKILERATSNLFDQDKKIEKLIEGKSI